MMIRQLTKIALLTLGLTVGQFAEALALKLTFEGAGDHATIDNFYNGGTDSLGNSGINYGISFNGLAQARPEGVFQNEPSRTTALVLFGTHEYINVAAGFTGSVSLSFTTGGSTSNLNVYSGLNGTGTLVGTAELLGTQPLAGCTGTPTPSGRFCYWYTASAAIAGLAKSIDITGATGTLLVDYIIISPSPVPEPAISALMFAGLCVLRAKIRRRESRQTYF